ncbi:MAG TPA: hypothetical protein VN934_05945 [Candidatus Tumulicola sp.]|nr:hypothetical protein [Candidatus Tumulicola sp.]
MQSSDVHNYADVATIVASIVVVFGSVIALWQAVRSKRALREKRKRLENVLRSEKQKQIDNGQRTVPFLISRTGLTEEEIMKAGVDNPLVRRVVSVNFDGKARQVLFEYVGDAKN